MYSMKYIGILIIFLINKPGVINFPIILYLLSITSHFCKVFWWKNHTFASFFDKNITFLYILVMISEKIFVSKLTLHFKNLFKLNSLVIFDIIISEVKRKDLSEKKFF